MRKGIIAGILVIALTFFTVAALQQNQNTVQNRTSITDTGVKKIHYLSNEKANHRNKNFLSDGKTQIQKVDMLKAGDNIKMELNSRPDIKVIDHNPQDKSHYYKNEVVVDFKMHPTEEQINQMYVDIDGVYREKLDSMYLFRARNKSTEELIRFFEKMANVEYAEPHFIYLQNQVNDTYYQSYQWNLPAIGTDTGWDITKGSKKIKVAVVDTGVDLDHPDLIGRLIPGYNALDKGAPPEDDNGHGTHVAGIIASDTNNARGVAGITWYNPIMPVKVMNAKGHGGSFDVADGIRWAVDHGANIINLSLGNYQSSAVLKKAVDYAVKKNVVIIAAAGNDNTNQPSYPAAYPGVLGVAAVDFNGVRADFSNYGDYVDVAAPGVDIPSTFSKGRYAALSGTSMAAPHVTGLAALIRSINPDLSNDDVLNIISSTTQNTGQITPNPYIGNGLIDNLSALQAAAAAQK